VLRATPQDLDEYPEFRDQLVKMGASPVSSADMQGPIQTKDLGPVERVRA